MKSSWLHSELSEEAPQDYRKNSGKIPQYEPEENSDEDQDLLQKAQEFVKKIEQDLKISFFELKNRDFLKKILRNLTISMRYISDQLTRLKRDLK